VVLIDKPLSIKLSQSVSGKKLLVKKMEGELCSPAASFTSNLLPDGPLASIL
jgi:hypothetical protein